MGCTLTHKGITNTLVIAVRYIQSLMSSSYRDDGPGRSFGNSRGLEASIVHPIAPGTSCSRRSLQWTRFRVWAWGLKVSKCKGIFLDESFLVSTVTDDSKHPWVLSTPNTWSKQDSHEGCVGDLDTSWPAKSFCVAQRHMQSKSVSSAQNMWTPFLGIEKQPGCLSRFCNARE